MAAHTLDDGNHAGVIHMAVPGDLHDGGGNILGGGSKAGAVIRSGQVVVNGLGHAHDPAFIAYPAHILRDFVAGIHRIVAAVVEEVAHIVLLEDLQDTLVIGVIHIRIGNLIPAGTQSGRGRGEQELQLLGVLFVHDHELIVQDALNAVVCAIDLGNGFVLQGRFDDAVGAGIDDSGRTAGLANNYRACQSFGRHL